MKRPALWIVLAAVSVMAAWVGVRYFPRAFSIVALNITMDRERALAQARDVMAREKFGPASYKQAASFTGDDEAQTFVELEGGGKEAFTRMLRDQSTRHTHGACGTSRRVKPTRPRFGSRPMESRTASSSKSGRMRPAPRSTVRRHARSPGPQRPGGMSIFASSTRWSRARSAVHRPRRPYLHLRTHIRNVEGGSVPSPARRFRGSA